MKILGGLWLLLGLLPACASYTDRTQEIRGFYHGEQYAQALKAIDESPLGEENRNRLLYRMEKAMILDRLEQRKKSRRLLIEADKIADELYTVSVSKTAASFIYNDSITDYEGEDYEKVAIHTLLAVSFLEDQNLKSARIEAKKINTKLHEINSRYDEHKSKYNEDAFARYLSGTIFEALGEDDSAIIDYTAAQKLYGGSYKNYAEVGVPRQLRDALYRLLIKRGRTQKARALAKKHPDVKKRYERRPKDAGEIVVIHEVGHIAVKEQENFVLPIGKQVVRFSFPVIRRRSYLDLGASVRVKSGPYYRGEQLQNLSNIAHQVLEDRRARMMLKEGARLLAKGQLTEQAYDKLGPLGGIAANIYSVATETADTRSWTTLPGAFYVTRIPLKPGSYQLEIRNGGRLSRIRKISVAKGKIAFLRDY